MKFSVDIKCPSCGEPAVVDAALTAQTFEWTCGSCGQQNSVLSHVNLTVGPRILWRARHEFLRREDHSMGIVFAAMAFECEMAYRYGKWRRIDARRAPPHDLPSEEEVEGDYRRLGYSIADRIAAVASFLDRRGLDDFVRGHEELGSSLEGFPSLSGTPLAEAFQRALFWPRNRILHFAYTGYGEDDARRCHNIAQLGVWMWQEMDLVRRSRGLTQPGKKGEGRRQ